ELTRTFAEYNAAAAFRAEQIAQGVTASMSIQKANAITFLHLGQLLTAYYFAYFLLILPVLGLRETPKGEPQSIHKSILGGSKATSKPKSDPAPAPVAEPVAVPAE
ncbi:MAG: hypothetical protein AAGK66_07960, partial [Pseudomonadota bacterium]